MRFLVNLFNHSPGGQRSLEDLVAIIGQQLRALGHEFDWSNEGFFAGPGHVNLLFEGFNEQMADIIEKIRKQGSHFVIIATEQPTTKGFNGGVVPEMIWRQEHFKLAAAHADAVWCLVPGTESWFRQWCPNVSYLDLGYAPMLQRFSEVEPTFEYGFFGQWTPRRDKILRQFGDKVHRSHNFLPQVQRDGEMAFCKVILQIRPHDNSVLVSSSRVNTALNLGRPVVAEFHALPGPWRHIITFASPKELKHEARRVARNWREIHKVQFGLFRAKLPPEACVGRCIAETLSQIPDLNPQALTA